jgi:methyl-accepting chemotaxis protein
MSWFSNLRLRVKLLGSFGLVCLIMAIVGGLGVSTAQRLETNLNGLGLNELPSTIALGETQSNLLLGQRGIRSAILADDPQAIKTYVDAGRKGLDDSDSALATYLAYPLAEEERSLGAPLPAALKAYRVFFDQAAALAVLNTPESQARAIDIILKQAATPAAVLNTNLPQLTQINKQQSEDAVKQSQDIYDQSLKLLLGALAAGILLSLGLGFFLARSIANAVTRVARTAQHIAQNDLASFAAMAQAMAAGDLTQRVSVTARRVDLSSTDELGAMAADFNVMIERLQATGAAFDEMGTNLRHLVGQVQESALSLADTSAQLGSAAAQTGSAVQQVTMAVQNVASGAQETSRSAQETTAAVGQLSQVIDGIARGATDQARQVQTTSTTATRMAAGIEQVAASATQMASASQQTRTAAEHGGQAVRETTAAMTEIQLVVGQAAGKVRELGTLGQKIGAVVETIDDIAEQTNLLALNAAIEAARAGEHGKGFAVVADEVRKLAERSGRETKQIAELINQVQTGTREAVGAMDSGAAKIELGSDKAAQAGQALDEILTAVQDTVRQVSDIASSSREMAGGARSVTDAMHSISAVVEQSSASTEQMAAQASAVNGAIQAIAAVSEEQSAATEQVLASTEQMSAQVEQMAAQAQELAATAEQLKGLVARFKLGDKVSAAATAAGRTAAVKTPTPLRRAA